MRRTLLLAVVLMMTAATGCIANAKQDPFAYTKKPLYTGGFDLEDGPDQQMFRVEDGSIAHVHVQVWVNETAGGARVEITDPSGKVLMDVTDDAAASFPLALGIWTVRVTPEGDAAGHVGILATRR